MKFPTIHLKVNNKAACGLKTGVGMELEDFKEEVKKKGILPMCKKCISTIKDQLTTK